MCIRLNFKIRFLLHFWFTQYGLRQHNYRSSCILYFFLELHDINFFDTWRSTCTQALQSMWNSARAVAYRKNKSITEIEELETNFAKYFPTYLLNLRSNQLIFILCLMNSELERLLLSSAVVQVLFNHVIDAITIWGCKN